MHLKRLLSWFSFHNINNVDMSINETWPELYRLKTKLYFKMDSIIFPTLKFSTPHDEDVRKGWPLTSKTWLNRGTSLRKCPEKVCCFEGPNEHSSLRPDEEDQPGFFLELSNQIED